MFDGIQEEGGGPAPLIVGLGGATRLGSSTERALQAALDAAAAFGARTVLLGGDLLTRLPLYSAESVRTAEQRRLLEMVRQADGLIIASPAYHGSLSGAVKNALDLLEDLREDRRPYLDGRAVGCLATAYGPQAGAGTLAALRSIVHALRGWPTPLGVALNGVDGLFDQAGGFKSVRDQEQVVEMARQVVEFARVSTGLRLPRG